MEIIKLRDSITVLRENIIEDMKAVIVSNYVIILILLFPSIYILHSLPQLLNIFSKTGSNVIIGLITALLSFILINSGMLLARKRHMGEPVSLKVIVSESMMWISVFIVFNKVRTSLALLFCGVLLYLEVLNHILTKPWDDYSFVGILFIVLAGLVGKSLNYIYMYSDGVLIKNIKGKERISISGTKKRVEDYKRLDKKINFNINTIFMVGSSFILLFVSYSELFLPLILILVGALNYLLYSYSYEKIMVEEQNGKKVELVRGFGVETEEEEDIVDNSIVDQKEEPNKVINRSNGNGGLSKESILGEHWYINDKPSIIEEEKEEEEEDPII